MTKADQIFIQNCKDILNSPFSDFDHPVRAKWPDGTPAHTKILPAVVNKYDLQEEFPIMTLRKVAWKSALTEILWIYQKASNVVADLGLHIWDQWMQPDGTIGKSYGYQVAKKVNYGGTKGLCNQMESVIWDLRHNPTNRAIIVDLFDPEDIPDMALRPCYFASQYCPTRRDTDGQWVLNLVLMQRSQDMFTANNWDLLGHAMLVILLSACCGMLPGTITHVIGNCHIYDRHIPLVEDMIQRAETNPNDFTAPRAYLSGRLDYGRKESFYLFTPDDFVVNGYQHDQTDYKFEVAI